MELRLTIAVATAARRLFPPESPVSHYMLDQAFKRYGMTDADPRRSEPQAGKMKRVGAVLIEAAQHDPIKGGELFRHLMGVLRGSGAFTSLASQPG